MGLDGLPAALGRSQAASTAAAVVAPVLGGALFSWYGVRVPLLVDAASFTAVTTAALAIVTRRDAPVLDHGRTGDRRGGWAVLRADPVLVRLVSMLSLFILLGSMVNVIEVFLVRQTLHASASWYGVLGAAWGVGVLAGALAGGRLRGQPSLLRVALGSCLLLGVGLAGMGMAPTVGWVLPACLVGGAANGLLSLTISALVGIRTPEPVRGRVSATVNGLTSAGQLGAMLVGGVLAAVLAPRQIFVVGGLLGMLAPLALGRGLLRAAAAPAAAALAAGPVVRWLLADRLVRRLLAGRLVNRLCERVRRQWSVRLADRWPA